MHRVQGEREIPVWFETHCLRIAETRRRQYFLIFLQIPNDFGFKLFVTALSGSQEMFLTLPPLVENPPAAAVNQDPCHTQIGKSKGSNDLWLCFDALGLCVLLGHWSIFFSWVAGNSSQSFNCRRQCRECFYFLGSNGGGNW